MLKELEELSKTSQVLVTYRESLNRLLSSQPTQEIVLQAFALPQQKKYLHEYIERLSGGVEGSKKIYMEKRQSFLQTNP